MYVKIYDIYGKVIDIMHIDYIGISTWLKAEELIEFYRNSTPFDMVVKTVIDRYQTKKHGQFYDCYEVISKKEYFEIRKELKEKWENLI